MVLISEIGHSLLDAVCCLDSAGTVPPQKNAVASSLSCHDTVVPLCLKVPEEASSNTYKHSTDASSPTATVHALLALLEAILCPGAYSEPALAGSANSGQKQKAPQQGVKPASSAAAKAAGMRLLSFN